jgi:hypothetical protein
MSDFVKATYDGKVCLLNMDYVMDIFPAATGYKAYTMDFDRGEYCISNAEFNKWMKKADRSEEDENDD